MFAVGPTYRMDPDEEGRPGGRLRPPARRSAAM